ncbi:MAG: hypothetical protein R3C14_14425 [Caldilineaceae bacterium]
MPTENGNDQEPDRERRRVSHELLLLVLTLLVLSFVLYNLWGLLDLLRTPLGQ